MINVSSSNPTAKFQTLSMGTFSTQFPDAIDSLPHLELRYTYTLQETGDLCSVLLLLHYEREHVCTWFDVCT